VTGSNFAIGITAKLGGLSVAVLYLSPTTIKIVSPAHGAGLVSLVLTNEPSNLSATKVAAFTYIDSTSGLNGPILIDRALPDLDPSPNGPSSFKVLFESGVDQLTLRIYTRAMVCVQSMTVPGNPSFAWQSISVPASAFKGFGGGLYYFVVTGSRGETTSPAFIGKFFILR
jgi:hypothetical protein